MNSIILNLIFFISACVIGYALCHYLYLIYSENDNKFTKILKPIENWIYKILKIKETEEMTAKGYIKAIFTFSFFSFIVLFLILILQQYLPFNPNNKEGLNISIAFNTAISFVTNTNWQNYSGENYLSYFSQSIGLTVQNFLSAAVGISVLFALFRGITNVERRYIGNFWRDLVRITLYILLPLSMVTSILLVSGGVLQTLKPNIEVQTIEDKTQVIKLGPVASQIAIKQLGSNGGGFFGANSAHPFENPNIFTNWIECISILVLPISLVFLFGKIVKDTRQGYAIFYSMLFFLIIALAIVTFVEQGNLDGKEIRFGETASSIWSVFTTSTSNGSVNSIHGLYSPVSNLVQIMLMTIGEIIFGGVGSGLYTMIGFVIISVFISGLMVGKTPEYLRKKIDPYEMKMAMLIVLVTPLCILLTASLICLSPMVLEELKDIGTNSFSEILYISASTGANNGSNMTKLEITKNWILILLGINMILARYLPIYAICHISESMGMKKKVIENAGTLKTTSILFVTVLIIIISIIGALTFLPAVSLGPIAEIL